MIPNFTFRGIRKDYLTVLKKERPYSAAKKRELLTVPNRPGGYLTDTVVDALIIPVRVMIDAPTHHALLKIAEDMVDWLYTSQPEPLVFDDETDRTYYAVVDGQLDKDEIVNFAYVDINFLCPDPHKYGMTKTENFVGDILQIQNNGSAEALPIFRGVAKGNITNMDIVTLDAYMRAGAPASITQTPIAPETSVFVDELANLTGWSPATVIDNGHVAGGMGSDGNGFVANTWGAVMTPAGWQGPVVKKSLPSPLQDFKAEIDLQQLNGVNEVGMIEIYFLDEVGNIVAKLGISDEWRASKLNQVKFQLGNIGNRINYNKQADNPRHWDDFKGVLRLTRRGKTFSAYFAKKDSSGNHHTRAFLSHVDNKGDYSAPIAQIQIAIRKWPDSDVPPTNMRVNKVEVWRLNDTTPQSPVYIAGAGDVIEIDHRVGNVTINGEPRLWLKDFGSTFFPLKKGENIISYSPSNLIDLSVTWQERYL